MGHSHFIKIAVSIWPIPKWIPVFLSSIAIVCSGSQMDGRRIIGILPYRSIPHDAAQKAGDADSLQLR